MDIDVNRSPPRQASFEVLDHAPEAADSNWFNSLLESAPPGKNPIKRANPDALSLSPSLNLLRSSSSDAGNSLEKLSKSSNPMDIMKTMRLLSDHGLNTNMVTKFVGKTFQACEKLTNLA